MAKRNPLDGIEPLSNAGGRPPALKPEHVAVLHDIVAEHAQASLQEIADELHHRYGRVCAAMIRQALHAQGIVRLKPARRILRGEPRAPSGMATRQPTGARIYRPAPPT